VGGSPGKWCSGPHEEEADGVSREDLCWILCGALRRKDGVIPDRAPQLDLMRVQFVVSRAKDPFPRGT